MLFEDANHTKGCADKSHSKNLLKIVLNDEHL